MIIDFGKLKVKNLVQKDGVLMDVREPLANGIYMNCQGIAAHALAMKIYNSNGEAEFTEQEYEMIKAYTDRMGTPMMIDAINNLKME